MISRASTLSVVWITKKPVGEMAAKYDPAEYEAIHSTYQDNLVYRDDANYIASLESIVDPVLRQAWIPDSWDILAGQFFQNWDPARHVKSFGQCVFEPWQPRWISIDRGFEHGPWCCGGRVSASKRILIREPSAPCCSATGSSSCGR